MARTFGKIEVDRDDLRTFQRTTRRAVDTELPKRLGQSNKSVGQLVISRLQPRPDEDAVGKGAGASVRPSASKREVLLRVGGKHRQGNTPQMQWGKRIGAFIRGRRPKRPYIRQTVEDNRKDIERAYLDGIRDAMSGSFAKTEI